MESRAPTPIKSRIPYTFLAFNTIEEAKAFVRDYPMYKRNKNLVSGPIDHMSSSKGTSSEWGSLSPNTLRKVGAEPCTGIPFSV